MLTKQKNKLQQVITIIAFVLAATAVVFLLPRERKFAYDYSKGSPWAHDDLTARFGFSIQKTPGEVQRERDSINRNLIPYFELDTGIALKNLNFFSDEFDKKWITYSMGEYRIDEEKQYLENNRYKVLRDIQVYYKNYLVDNLNKLYTDGIIRLPEFEEIEIQEKSSIYIKKNQLSEETTRNKLRTSKEAYTELLNELNAERARDLKKHVKRYDNFFNSLEIDRFIQENVLYDKKATELDRNEQQKTLSETKGFIQEGVLLISRGIIVTAETFQVLESYKYQFENQRGDVSNILAWTGRAILSIISFLVVYLFLFNFRREILYSLTRTSFLLFMMVLMIFIASMVSGYEKKFFYVVPFTILPIIIRPFYDERVGLFIHVVTVMLAGLMALNSFDFIFMTIIAGMVALFSLTNLYHRSQYFIASLLVVITYAITYIGITVIKEGSFAQMEVNNFMYFVLHGIFTLLSFLLIYGFEKVFGFLSDTTLMELSDTNHPLLKKLLELAPATFQHSLQVGNLAEDAIRNIGGNPLLVRTGAYYHDIGKMANATYFTENQAGGPSPHKDKDLKESAKIIIDHVNAGKELAGKNKLPKAIVDFILTHHGTSTTKYFLKTYQNENPDAEVDEKDFQYPGPKPLSKETAVLMMADSVEAASRSLESYTQESISELVERIIDSQMAEGQFEEADITFKDIKKVKEVFKARLNTFYHVRIAYPK